MEGRSCVHTGGWDDVSPYATEVKVQLESRLHGTSWRSTGTVETRALQQSALVDTIDGVITRDLWRCFSVSIEVFPSRDEKAPPVDVEEVALQG